MPSTINRLGPDVAHHPALGSTGDIEMQNRVISVNGLFVDQMSTATPSANNLKLPTNGDSWHITGTTQINLISYVGWRSGSRITLIFDGALTVKNNQSASGNFRPILLNGGSDFTAAANRTLSLLYDGVNNNWLEIGRKT